MIPGAIIILDRKPETPAPIRTRLECVDYGCPFRGKIGGSTKDAVWIKTRIGANEYALFNLHDGGCGGDLFNRWKDDLSCLIVEDYKPVRMTVTLEDMK